MAKSKQIHAKGPPQAPALGLRPDRVKKRREELGWTQPDLAYRIGVHPSHLSVIERGKADVAASLVAAIALVLAVSADWILGLSDDPKPHGRN